MRRGAFDFYVAISESTDKASEAKKQWNVQDLRAVKNMSLQDLNFLKNLAIFPEGLFYVERSVLPLRQ